MKSKLLLTIVMAVLLSGCSGASDEPVANMSELALSFADQTWDGIRVPEGQQCHRFGGINPQTPAIEISNIPSEADAIILSFSDGSYEPMDNGGHGEIGYEIAKGIETIVVPSVPGHTFDLPEGFFLVAEQRNPDWDDAGAYLPPCSGGSGNSYYVTVRAVSREDQEGEKPLLLGEGTLQLGSY